MTTRMSVEAMRSKNKRPKICFAVSYFPKYFPAGAEIQTYFIARHMLARGWAVHFTTEDCGQPTGKLENEDGIWVHKFKSTRFFNPLRCWSFYRELLRINADVYYQRVGTEYTFVTAMVARALRSKFVWSTSSAPDCEGDRYRRSLRDAGAKGLKRWILWGDASIRDFLIARGRKRADVIVVQDESQRAAMKSNLGRDSIVIKTGHLPPENPEEREQPPTVVWVANAKREKRPELFIQLAKACSDLPASFVLVGGRSQSSYRRELTDASRGVSNLEFKWGASFEQTNRLLSRAGLLVSTSTREGFPNTFVQAWLRETPAVSLMVDPNGVLRREGIGLCSESFPQMVEDVRRLLSDKSLREQMGRKGKAYALKEHSLSDKLGQYTDLFESLYEGRMVQSA